MAKPIDFATLKVDEARVRSLLPKLRKKGSDAQVSLKQILQVLKFLGGWKVEYKPALASLSRHEADSFSRSNEAEVVAERERYLRMPALSTGPVKVGETYADQVGEITSSAGYNTTWYQFQYRAWLGVDCYTVTSPDGKVYKIRPERHEGAEVRLTSRPYGFFDWLRIETNYLRQVSDALGLPTYQEERENAKPRTRENTGTCPCCFRNHKLASKGKEEGRPGMVLHGYERPGHGYLNGQCFGVYYAPYELSSAGTNDFRAWFAERLANEQGVLARLKGGEVDELYESRGFRKPPVLVKKGDPSFDSLLRSKIVDVEMKINHIERTIAFLDKRIASWSLRPLPCEGEPIKEYEIP